MPLNIVTQLLADWLLIGLVVLALLAFAAVVCGLAGYLPSWYLLRRSSLPTPKLRQQMEEYHARQSGIFHRARRRP